MSRLIVFILITFFFLRLPLDFKNSFSLSAQETAEEDTPFEKAYKVYLVELEEYQVAHSDFSIKRSNYQRFRTLQSQEEAQAATVKMLTERDEVIITYLTALRERLDEAEAINPSRKSNLHVRIAADLAWFTDHKNKIPTAGTLKELEEDNRKASQRFTFVEPLFYEISVTISDGRITDFEERLNDIFGQVKTKITEIKNDTREEYQLTDRQISLLDRWILDTENKILRAEEKQIAAGKEIDNLTTAAQRKQLPLNTYNTAILRLNEAKQQLKEGGSFIVEIIRVIKTKDD